MKPTTVAKFFAGRMHYAWVVLVVMFFAMLAGVGVRAAPGVMILPLERAFGWSVGTISAARVDQHHPDGLYRTVFDRSGATEDTCAAAALGAHGAILPSQNR